MQSKIFVSDDFEVIELPDGQANAGDDNYLKNSFPAFIS